MTATPGPSSGLRPSPRPSLRVVEVGPRDGLQNEPRTLDPVDRIAFVEALADAGLATIEVGSFVSPQRVPQMAGSDAVLRAVASRPIASRPGIRFPVLVPNRIGMERAIEAGAREVALFVSASEAFSRANLNCSVAASLGHAEPVFALARQHGIAVRGYVSCVLGCPYEGEVPGATVASLARHLVERGCYEVSLGDTIGVGTPGRARHLVEAVAASVPVDRLAVHFHDTYGQALANVLACLELGIGVVDSAAGGLGGCPYAVGASGNLATEDLVTMLDGMGIATGVDLERLRQATASVAASLGIAPRSKAYQAMSARMHRSGACGASGSGTGS